MYSQAIQRILVIAFGTLLLAHCGHNPVADKHDVQLPAQPQAPSGAEAHRAVLKEYATLANPALQAYVKQVGEQVAKQSRIAHRDWHFTVLDSPEVNAFSLPDGHVYLTRGILAYLNSEAQLAAIIAHELAHVEAGDAAREPSARTAAAPSLALDVREDAADARAAALVQELAPSWAEGHGRTRERDADRHAVEYLERAGYAAGAMTEALEALQNQATFAAREAKLSGHPARTYHAVADRLEARDAHAVATPSPVSAGRNGGRDDYLRTLAGLYFGDSPEQGLLRDNLLLHEKLGLAIQFPPGWPVQNRPDRVLAQSPKGDAAVELLLGPKSEQPMETLQRDVKLDAGARYDSGKLSGYAAAFAAGAQQGQPAVVAVVVFNGVQYLVAGIARDIASYERERSTLRAVINSFRAITPAERAATRAHVLRLITAKPGTTMARLARQSPLGAEAESQLRLLNGLYPQGEPKPGQLVKIVH